MKKFNVTVNGTAYDVEVNEVKAAAPAAAPKAAPAAAPAPKAAPAPAPAPAAASASAQNEDEVVAAIVGAIVAMGYSSEQIASIRPTATSAKWRLEGRLSGRG